jgi:SAM-dependent methyltransferase
MPEPLDPALDEVRQQLLDASLVRAVAAGQRRSQRPAWRRAELRWVQIKAGRHLQVTTYDQSQAHTRNHPAGEPAREAVDALLGEPFGNWHVDTATQTLQLRVTKRGDAQLHRSPRAPADEPAASPVAGAAGALAVPVAGPHDRPKQRLLDPADPFWAAVGIAGRDGTVKPSRQAKLRQVEEFLRLLAPAIDDALAAGALRPPTPQRPLRVVDLGCGNAYLTFAAFRFLDSTRRLPVRLVGVDVKTAARTRNQRLAAELGWAEGLRFVEGTIGVADVGADPDVVLALHACDTATDDALARAVRWRAGLILTAPCCHHDLQTQLGKAPAAPPPYGLLTGQGILRERFADVLTDALRATLLRLLGYRVDVVEFVGGEHTPRNVALRAIRTDAPPSPRLREEYVALTSAWGVVPALARALPAECEAVLGAEAGR